jgi:hypothetical protein
LSSEFSASLCSFYSFPWRSPKKHLKFKPLRGSVKTENFNVHFWSHCQVAKAKGNNNSHQTRSLFLHNLNFQIHCCREVSFASFSQPKKDVGFVMKLTFETSQGTRSPGKFLVANMRSKFLEDIRFGVLNARKREGDKMDISKLLEFSGETPDGEGRAWFYSGDEHAGL